VTKRQNNLRVKNIILNNIDTIVVRWYYIGEVKKMPKNRTSIALSDEMLDLVKREAAEQRRSVHNMLVYIVEEYFAQKEKDHTKEQTEK